MLQLSNIKVKTPYGFDAESVPLMKEVKDLNRALHNTYVDFLRPLQHTSDMGFRPATTTRSVELSRDPSTSRDPDDWKTDSSSDDGNTSIREPSTTEKQRLSAAVRSRIATQSTPFLTAPGGPSKTSPGDEALQKSESSEKPVRRIAGRLVRKTVRKTSDSPPVHLLAPLDNDPVARQQTWAIFRANAKRIHDSKCEEGDESLQQPRQSQRSRSKKQFRYEPEAKFIEIFPATPTLATPLTILPPHPHPV
jgi:hypothetical protein